MLMSNKWRLFLQTLPAVRKLIFTIPGDNRHYVKIQIKDQDFTAMLDDGSQSTVIGSKFSSELQSLNLKMEQTDTTASPADGKTGKTHLCFKLEIPIKFINKQRFISALYVPTFPKGLVLGMNFWEEHNIKPVVLCDEIEIQSPISVSQPHDLSHEQAHQLSEMLTQMSFTIKDSPLSRTHLTVPKIDTGDNKPFKDKSPYLLEKAKAEVERLLKLGVVYKCPPYHQHGIIQSYWCLSQMEP